MDCIVLGCDNVWKVEVKYTSMSSNNIITNYAFPPYTADLLKSNIQDNSENQSPSLPTHENNNEIENLRLIGNQGNVKEKQHK